jgi:O-antigen/teichoic acid export membrane protein
MKRSGTRSTAHNPGLAGDGQVFSLVGGSAFIFACRIAGAGLTFASQILLARWMGAAELGAYVIAFSWCILLSTVATGGMPLAAMRFVGSALARDDNSCVRGFMRRGTQIALAGGVIVMVLGGAVLLLGRTLVAPLYLPPLLVAAAIVPLLSVLNFYGGASNAFPWLGQSFLPTNVLRPLLFLAVLWASASASRAMGAVEAMQLQWVVVAVLAALGSIAFHWRLHVEVPARERRYETRLWLRTGAPLLGVAIFTAYLPEITVVLAGFWLNSAEVAVFQVSYRIALLIGFGLFAVDAYTAPHAARLIADTDRDNLQEVVNRATRLRFWPALAAVVALSACGRWALGLFGEEFTAGYVVLIILAFGQLAQAAVGPVSRLMALSGHQDRSFIASVGSLLVLIPLMALLAPRFGMTGAAVAALVDMVLWSLWMRYLIVASLGIRPSVL